MFVVRGETTPSDPGTACRTGPNHVTGDEMVGRPIETRSAVDGAILHPPPFFPCNQYDASLCGRVQRPPSGRFAPWSSRSPERCGPSGRCPSPTGRSRPGRCRHPHADAARGEPPPSGAPDDPWPRPDTCQRGRPPHCRSNIPVLGAFGGRRRA